VVVADCESCFAQCDKWWKLEVVGGGKIRGKVRAFDDANQGSSCRRTFSEIVLMC
jgi:hypothetical protein